MSARPYEDTTLAHPPVWPARRRQAPRTRPPLRRTQPQQLRQIPLHRPNGGTIRSRTGGQTTYYLGQQQSVIDAVLGLELDRPNWADVQNRVNRTCKGCQVKFYTREAFLEHCQMVHCMGILTESG